ncbi:MAG: CpsD/CapB family tyrosine-protein kinase [Candidatus Zixiibacteriota bacterium]|nr:MAG: CpsD/CapB family tyrosine-protein kinase [candidate division Zixibacteria bacterium]
MSSRKTFQSIASLYDRESSYATELRRIYSNLKSKNDGDSQSVLITSAMIGEGKSLTSSYLAITVANLTQLKVVLVDFDLRRPKIHEYFNVGSRPGVTDIIKGELKVKSAARKSSIPNLQIISSGAAAKVVGELIDQADLSTIIQELKFYFDFVVIDSPPVIPVSDPLLIGDHVDGVIMVVRAGSTQKEVFKRAINVLKNASINVYGAVVNDYEDVLPYYFKDRYYGYHYSSPQDLKTS